MESRGKWIENRKSGGKRERKHEGTRKKESGKGEMPNKGGERGGGSANMRREAWQQRRRKGDTETGRLGRNNMEYIRKDGKGEVKKYIYGLERCRE